MKKSIFISFAAIGIIVLLAVACQQGAATPEKPSEKDLQADLVKKGERLVTLGGCDDCHSPKKMGPAGPEVDRERRLSGYPSNRPLGPVDAGVIKNGWVMFGPDLTNAVGPWGVSFAANLTSDESGIGNWTEAQFFKALREGKFMGLDNTRPILPPMPWQNFKALTDEELRSIFAYLKTTKPVYNVVPAPMALADLKK